MKRIAKPKVLFIGDISRCTGAPTWAIRRAIARGILATPDRVGVSRYWFESDLPEITMALQRAGYLRRREEVPS
jgi:hypothetical protein